MHWLDIQDKKIFQIGYGGIGNCMIPLFKKHLKIKPGNHIVIDMKEEVLPKSYSSQSKTGINGVIYYHMKMTKHNYIEILEKFLSPGDLLLDLAWCIDTLSLLKWCHSHNVKYVNAAVEVWDVKQENPTYDPRYYSLYERQIKIQEQIKKWNYNGPTAILTHGANPGWVSHATKFALREWATKLASEKKLSSKQVNELISNKQYPELSKLLNVQVIHISELDTLRQSIPREQNEFICTWSPEGFIEEGMAPAELGWGTHETMKEGIYKYSYGIKNQICMATRGMNTLCQSYVPNQNYVGMIIRHEEAYSISDYLTVKENQKVVYRPTVHYVYKPCSDAISSMYDLQSNGYKHPDKLRIPKKELIDGNDYLGCFLLSRDYGAWWIGTLQSVEDAKQLIPNQGPTILVVAAGVLGAVIYAFNNPDLGVIHPEKMDEDIAMSYILPYLKPFVSMEVPKWKPFVTSKFDSSSLDKKTKDWIIQKLLV